MSDVSIVTSRRRVEIQSTSEKAPYFTMTKCNKLFITSLTLTLTKSFIHYFNHFNAVVKTTLFNTRAQCSV